MAAGTSSAPVRDKAIAGLVHLAISGCIVGAVGALMLLWWYPQPWFRHDGGWTVYRLILLVDVVLGPLLTLIVYRRNKPGLKRDLTVIAAIQLGALAFGVTTMLQHRPVFIVFAENNFFTVSWTEVRSATRDAARIERLRDTSGQARLPLVFLQLPPDPAKRAALRAIQDRGGPPVPAQGDYYEAMDDAHWATVLGMGADIEALARNDAAIRAELERFRSRHPGPLASLVFLPVVCRSNVLMLAFDRRSRELLDWLE